MKQNRRPVMRLANGICAYLEYNFQCGKGRLFSEKYLAEPIGTILQSAFDYQVFAEYNHPYIINKALGRPTQLDFAGMDGNKFVTAIETKWFGKNQLDHKEWLWDCYRLALISAENTDALCLLVASGINNIGLPSKFIRVDNNPYKNIVLSNGDERGRVILNRSRKYQINTLIKSIMVYPPICATSGTSGNSWKTLCWRIKSTKLHNPKVCISEYSI